MSQSFFMAGEGSTAFWAVVSVISNEQKKYLRSKQNDRVPDQFLTKSKCEAFLLVYSRLSPFSSAATMSEASMRLNAPSDGSATPQAASMASAWVGLDTWPRHRTAELVALAPARDAEQARTLHRLAEIGFLPGETLRVVSRGWLRGGPIAVRVGQSTFALRAHEAALLRVRAASAEG